MVVEVMRFFGIHAIHRGAKHPPSSCGGDKHLDVIPLVTMLMLHCINLHDDEDHDDEDHSLMMIFIVIIIFIIIYDHLHHHVLP